RPDDLRAGVDPEAVVGSRVSGRRRPIDELIADRALFQLCRLVGGQRVPSFEFLRALKERDRREGPDSLQIRMAVSEARRTGLLFAWPAGACRNGGTQQRTADATTVPRAKTDGSPFGRAERIWVPL